MNLNSIRNKKSNLKIEIPKNSELVTIENGFKFTEISTFYILCAYQIGKIIDLLDIGDNDFRENNTDKIFITIKQIHFFARKFLIELNFTDIINNQYEICSKSKFQLTKIQRNLIYEYLASLVNLLARMKILMILIKRKIIDSKTFNSDLDFIIFISQIKKLTFDTLIKLEALNTSNN